MTAEPREPREPREPGEPRPAATVLVLRDGPRGPEVLMVRRHARAAFMAGAHVFPGGVVDAADRDAAARGRCDGLAHAASQTPDLDAVEALAVHVAAARELFEEAGVLLARDTSRAFVRLGSPSLQARFGQHRRDIHAGTRTFPDVLDGEGLRLAVDALVVCAHWVTPPLDTRRFDTRFFATRLPTDQRALHDEHETSESRWMRAIDAMAAAKLREIVLPPPTWMMLRELVPLGSVDAILAWARGRRVLRREPTLIQEDGVRTLVMEGGESVSRETRFVWSGDRWWPHPGGATE